ncbi:glycoside hydrolase superfamily [Kalaharituber pfeilii]|nr:glycoside hydrolase superfamily [Kalaharituber pfeilii]
MLDYSTLPSPLSHPPGSFLRVSGTQIVNEAGETILLRGCGLGGWMLMENFITGFPGHEIKFREAMLATLGQRTYEFFFDRYLYHFFNEKDVKLFASLGLNCIRLPFDYRHFENDMDPMVLKPQGFKHLDRVISTCARYGVYTILDMHAVPGGQNPSSHSNNITSHASFWDHKHFQDRAIWLWQQIAARYRDNPWVAGYNPLNEPADGSPQAHKLVQFYQRIEKGIREVDDKHIVFWDGNTFATDWSGFESLVGDGKGGKKKAGIFPNSAYSCHDYGVYGFPLAERYTGSPEQKWIIRQNYEKKVSFMKRNGLCIWNGEFGPVYANEEDDGPDWMTINVGRMDMLQYQLEIYESEKISWSIWLWKDIGYQGMVYTPPDSPYIKLFHAWLQKKRRLNIDYWGNRPQPDVVSLFKPIEEWVDYHSPAAKYTYPKTWGLKRHIMRGVTEIFLSDSLQGEFVSYFDGKTEEELDELLTSFSLKDEGEKEEGGDGWAVQRGYLNELLRQHNGRVTAATRANK